MTVTRANFWYKSEIHIGGGRITRSWNSDVEWKIKWADLFPAYQTSIKKSSDGLESIKKILHSGPGWSKDG